MVNQNKNIRYYLITNNPLVQSNYRHIEHVAVDSYIDVLTKVRDLIHKGAILISHPQAGSIKPYETPYRSIIVTATTSNQIDYSSLSHIENAIERFHALGGIHAKTDNEQRLKDFQIVDESLILSAIHTLR